MYLVISVGISDIPFMSLITLWDLYLVYKPLWVKVYWHDSATLHTAFVPNEKNLSKYNVYELDDFEFTDGVLTVIFKRRKT